MVFLFFSQQDSRRWGVCPRASVRVLATVVDVPRQGSVAVHFALRGLCGPGVDAHRLAQLWLPVCSPWPGAPARPRHDQPPPQTAASPGTGGCVCPLDGCDCWSVRCPRPLRTVLGPPHHPHNEALLLKLPVIIDGYFLRSWPEEVLFSRSLKRFHFLPINSYQNHGQKSRLSDYLFLCGWWPCHFLSTSSALTTSRDMLRYSVYIVFCPFDV